MFNRLPDLPEALIAGREQAYLTYMFDKWSHRRDRVAAQVLYRRLRGAGRPARGLLVLPGDSGNGAAECRARPAQPAMPVLAIGAEHATRARR